MVAAPLVLIVDDEESVRSVLADVLSWLGCRPWMSADGQDLQGQPGLEQVRLALVDRYLERRDGTAVAARLAALGIPVVLMSGSPEMGHPRRFSFLAKPFDLERLRDLLACFGLVREGDRAAQC